MLEAKIINYSKGKNKGKQKAIEIYKDGELIGSRQTKNKYNTVTILGGYVFTFHRSRYLAEKSTKEKQNRYLNEKVEYFSFENNERDGEETKKEEKEITFEKFKNMWLASNDYTIVTQTYPEKDVYVKDDKGDVVENGFASTTSAKNFVKGLAK